MAVALNWTRFGAVLFDLDGVVTPTAEVHERAWSELFADYDFTPHDYLTYVDGKPRYDGVRSFVASRGIALPDGDPGDPPGDTTICALGNSKNAAFQHVLRTDGIAAYPGSLRLLAELDERGIAAAVVSSSRNAREVLDAAGLGDRFGVVIDGVVAAADGLAGKPAPDTFAAAAQRLGVEPARAIVAEDAIAGVAAGRAGGFVVVGVDRGAGHRALYDAGADVVVSDLSELLPSTME